MTNILRIKRKKKRNAIWTVSIVPKVARHMHTSPLVDVLVT